MFAQTTHVANVLLVGHGVDNATRAQEQQRFEEGVRHNVEHRRGAVSYTHLDVYKRQEYK